eukprot:CAMPEP_0175820908 /NCGR_PEP_ID=MMETSP0107_2-20121207/8853_1 /TAXON_ID=195067 ORGANISM="Goniomonas pacifica, Strain CCMP1869" /NCGR_SAMPLE_ID=MMETSP0107_2 /ASSEMBLY_ACC=CAM_ASM_000203 /LENGTH=76 /DNA_ID=CAMNT_0017133253 /DNA_START=88 /DNA_END=315 /DNA_ORIENTATION=-
MATAVMARAPRRKEGALRPEAALLQPMALTAFVMLELSMDTAMQLPSDFTAGVIMGVWWHLELFMNILRDILPSLH